ncbi:restriction endonuclease subunit S [Klebsiella pneumoniae]|uniref:restriction endonuclease subunit S n=1 Tax=Klebsiella pneumoniae TaxID=573 RepID=UPI001AE4E987|nr:restriction endonuclease subunit S [Klebsiella pneumoniae]MBP0671504.1 restriction endonuclease subunit S [Klebsiella pneumoniae]MBP0676779.1 restriction endonuclease subunit S [Klebsiella pneumoniae]MCV0446113.1 restriction endonuclease subunit S [Klebsiella pneumoniae]HCK7110986.1 restriction endonuclease subunit S [Klebsiella pneumoniae]
MTTDNLPNKWIKTKLGTLIELKYGKSLAAHSRDGIGFDVFGSNGVVGKHSTALVNTHGLIVGRKGSHGVVNKSIAPFFPIDTTYYVDEFHQQPINFWFYYLTFLPLTRLNRSTAIPGLNRDDAYDLDIMLPSISEQKIIADKLDDLLARVESIKTRLENIPEILKKFRQSVLSAAVSGKLTEEWRKENNQSFSDWISCNVGEVSTVSTGKTPKRNEPRFWENGSIPWLTSSSTGDINTHIAEQFVTEAALEECNLKLYSPGTLLLAMYGEGKTRGQVTEIKISATCNQACAAITCDETKIITHFLKLRLLENYQEIRKAAVGGNQPNLNLNKVRDIFVLVPSLAEQQEIINRVNHFFDYANFTEKMLGKALSRIYDLTQSILAKAFRGELTAQWREENPELISGLNSAEALLEKITAEKLAAGTVKKHTKKTSR